jgi:hypothetical protein
MPYLLGGFVIEMGAAVPEEQFRWVAGWAKVGTFPIFYL